MVVKQKTFGFPKVYDRYFFTFAVFVGSGSNFIPPASTTCLPISGLYIQSQIEHTGDPQEHQPVD